jgi:uncharacterized membrane protein YsdA (DUF1294 family)
MIAHAALIYIALSLVTFLVYASDKSAARKGEQRTRESTLHLLALACGWPGALLAQHLLRHKSRKLAFRGIFWLTVIANLVLLSGAFSVVRFLTENLA